LRADWFIVRTQSTIRADGPPSAQVLALQFDVSSYIRRFWRAAIARCARQACFLYG